MSQTITTMRVIRDETPAIPQDEEVGKLFKQLAAKCGVAFPEHGWSRASLIADVQEHRVSLVIEVPATVGAIASCLEKPA